MARNIDIVDTDKYEQLQNEAANSVVRTMPYGGSVEALAMKQAFVFGADTALQFKDHEVSMLMMIRAGREWAMKEAIL